jgi:glucose-6-phosphate 1-dehydrogenase
LAEFGLLREENGRWRRVIIEKPFGHDLDSARQLIANINISIVSFSIMDQASAHRPDSFTRQQLFLRSPATWAARIQPILKA